MDRIGVIKKTVAEWIDTDVLAEQLVEALEDESVFVSVEQAEDLWLACLEDIGPLLTTIVQHRYV